MRLICYSILLFFLSFQSKAQNTDFVFNQERNTLVTQQEGKSPYAFEILSEKGTTTIKKPSTKRISEHYKRTLAFAEKAKTDYQKIVQLKKEGKYTSAIRKTLNETEVNNRLRVAQRSLKSVKKYEIIPSKITFEKHNELKVRRSVFKPQNVILGKYKSLGSFYVIKNEQDHKERILISVADAKKKKLTSEHFLFDNAFEVIQNTYTKVIYMVYPDFLEKYPAKQDNRISRLILN